MDEIYPRNAKALHTETGIVKFPSNIHGIYVEPGATGSKVLTVRQNDVRLSFVLEEEDCRHLAALLTPSGKDGGGQ